MSFNEIEGGFNDPPPNLEEIGSDEFAISAFFQRTSDGCIEAYRQFLPPGRTGPYACVKLYQWEADGEGIAIASETVQPRTSVGVTTTFWKFSACLHDLKFHSHEYLHAPTYRCAKCDAFVGGQDTSG